MNCRGCGDCFDATTLASHQSKCKAQNRQDDDELHSYRAVQLSSAVTRDLPLAAQAFANPPAAQKRANPPAAQARANPTAAQERSYPPAAQTKVNPSSAKVMGVQPPALQAATKNPLPLAQARANQPSAQTRANPPIAQTIANSPEAHGRVVQPPSAVTRDLPPSSQAFAHPPAAEAAFHPPAQLLDLPEPNAASIKEIMTEVLSLFPDVDEAYLKSLALQEAGPMAVNNICSFLLERQYPRKKRPETDSVKTELVNKTINYFIPAFQEMHDDTYYGNASALLLVEFVWFDARFITKALYTLKNYASTYRFLAEIWKQIAIQTKLKDNVKSEKSKLSAMTFEVEIDQEISRPEAGSSTGTGKGKVKVTLLKSRRQLSKSSPQICPALQTEIDWVREKCKELEAEADREIAMGLNEEEYELQGQYIECGCCYGEFPFESMVQCCDGHLFCQGCLQQKARESVFGQGKADLKCMTDRCGSSFPKSQLVRALPREMLARYEDRVAEENLKLADLGDLVKCPHCEFRAFMDKSDKVFRCQNDKCMKETCRYCQVGWDEHFGKPCSEVVKRDETKLRLEYEEKMTKAKVQMCQRCNAQFTKEDGCNGATMCYICREPDDPNVESMSKHEVADIEQG
ncbi:E3 ubiquitin-protein ligase RNF216-like [Dreissena polymorpha]|uniref:E3 ubiquitin-protein ligase RNF216-like n=1 Tax=Dreissena polymorpha TaxID=45954 RepID=UPI002264C05F|nr:E3 ubiquitin-protein ligase RNF216-like [Dreissena polymorpha]